ncbi:hypothetical protein Y032_0002g1119 [Ancylostoma ceylanicum]|uniref:Uncharacterized protein n=1 Tax=Ancylostoma ceylanicum TaxID=53326 RepID=A0A016VZK6_9BILA|nr:hypothetical protein Y032_0002g1119 [Ancylostoma ceylanicum]
MLQCASEIVTPRTHISATSSKKMDDFAIRVFPSARSAAMRQSDKVLHYSPIADPPIDYTLHKPKQNGM